MPQAAASLALKFVHFTFTTDLPSLNTLEDPGRIGFIGFSECCRLFLYLLIFNSKLRAAVCDVRAEPFRKHRPTFAKETIVRIHCVPRNCVRPLKS